MIKNELTGIEHPIERILVFGPESQAVISKEGIAKQVEQLLPEYQRPALWRVVALLNNEYKALTIRRAWLQLEGREMHDDMKTVIDRMRIVDEASRHFLFVLTDKEI